MEIVRIPWAHIPVRVRLGLPETDKLAMMWTSVMLQCLSVTSMQIVGTLSALINVRAKLDLLETEKHARISMTVQFIRVRTTGPAQTE